MGIPPPSLPPAGAQEVAAEWAGWHGGLSHFFCGFHAVPTFSQLHMHVVSKVRAATAWRMQCAWAVLLPSHPTADRRCATYQVTLSGCLTALC